MFMKRSLARAYNLKLLFPTTKFNTIFLFLTHQQIVLKSIK